MSEIVVRRYTSDSKEVWNNFVNEARNATFLFNRDYMDYHSDRFRDHSLIVYVRGKVEALFVANEAGDTIHSHAGLTYGGLVVGSETRLEQVIQLFFHILRYYHNNSLKFIQYKCFPSYFATHASYEDWYALFLLNAELIKREAGCVLSYNEPLPYRDNREKSVENSRARSYKIATSNDPGDFWNKVLEPNLHQRFGTKPVHSVQEMTLLMSRFPSSIKLYEVHDEDLVAGAVIYEMKNAVHAQYLSTTPTGRKQGALDVLVDDLITNVYRHKKYFSFGTSNENEGRTLNRGLMSWKEGFGARMRIHDSYRIETKNFELIASYE